MTLAANAVQIVSAAEAASRRYMIHLPNGVEPWVSSYFGISIAEARARGLLRADGSGMPPGPVAYLVEQPARTTIPGHYHQVDQFQVFIARDGKFGAESLQGVHLHYAAAFTPYAAITAGDTTLDYFTLRPGFDAGAQWMPESKQRLLAQKRSFRAELGVVDLDDGREGATPVLPLDPTGLGAWCYRLRPHATARTQDGAKGGGQFLLVLRGACTIAGAAAGEHAIAYLAPEHVPVVITTDASGADVLLVQFAAQRKVATSPPASGSD